MRRLALRGVRILVALAFILANPRAAHANWPHNPAVNVPVCTANADQQSVIAVTDANGGAFITWGLDARNVNGMDYNYDVYIQHVAASGAVDASWPVNGVPVCTAANIQYAYDMIADGSGGVILAWEDLRSATSGDIYVQRVNASGVPMWTANGVAVCTDDSLQLFPRLVSDNAGGAIVVWSDWRNGISSPDLFAQHVNAAGVPLWTPNGVALCTATGDQGRVSIVTDGAGGAIVSWDDGRSSTGRDIYAQRLNSAGVPQWAADGVPVSTGAGESPASVADGAGGAILAWTDRRNGPSGDIYAQHVSSLGATTWVPGGTAVCNDGGVQEFASMVSDGAGGAVLCWDDQRLGSAPWAQRMSATGSALWASNGVRLSSASSLSRGEWPAMVSDGSGGAYVAWGSGAVFSDVYAQHVTSSGTIPASWPTAGRVVCNAANAQDYPGVASSASGQFIVAWEDQRSGVDSDIYAQLVAPSGFLAVPNPTIRPARDLPFDQGGFVSVPWDASYLDTDEPFVVDHYWMTRTAPPDVLAAATALGRVFTPEDWGAAEVAGGAPPGLPSVIVTGTGATASYWEPLQRVDALHSVPSYDAVAPTTSDSTAAGNPLTSFMVIAYDPTGAIALSSDPATGYSVDNLPPATPGHFTADPASGLTRLHWGPSPDRDLAGYHLYGGGTPDFTPGPTNLIVSLPDTEYTDPVGSSAWYKLSAVDIHGNESPYAVAQGFATESVDGSLARELSLSRPAPNPARRAAAIALTLPHAAHARLAIFDVAGRLERTLLDGALPPGGHTITWDLRDEAAAAVRAGLYFVRLESEGRSLTQRLVVAGI